MENRFENVLNKTLNNILLQWDKKIDRDITANLPNDVTLNDAKIMYNIYIFNDDINASILMKMLNVTKGTLSVNIEKLSKRGYLLKESATFDGRMTILKLSEKGAKIAKIYAKFINNIISCISTDLNSYEKSLLLISLSKVEDFLYE